ncbi:MAG: hypothetical protein ABR497_02710 [Kiritimatiellia bacterium]|nr:hypothetical protein [Lentisphaerota bacterium]
MNKCLPTVMTALCLALLITGCRSSGSSSPEPVHTYPAPQWTLHPKPADSVYFYVVGSSVNQSSPADARAEAYQDALRQISRQIVTEAGLGLAALPPGGILLPMEGAAILPGCVYVERFGNACNGFVQVSFPIVEKRKIIESLR